MGTLKESRDALVAAAAGWDGVASELTAAYYEITGYTGQGYQFGWFAQRAGIDEQHDKFMSSMVSALLDGAAVMREVAQALRDTAKDFGATDTSVRDTFHNLDGTPR